MASSMMTPATFAVETKMRKSSASFVANFCGISGFPNTPGSYTSSPPVNLEDSLWSVRIYPGGFDESSEGNLSCFVACERHAAYQATRASFRISVLNQKGWKNQHFSSDAVKDFSEISQITGMQGIHGSSKFVSQAHLRASSNGICVDDKLIIRVELVIYGALEQSTCSPSLLVPGSAGPKRRSMSEDLVDLFGSLALADVTIVAGPGQGQGESIFGEEGHMGHPRRSISEDSDLEPELDTSVGEEEEVVASFPAHKLILSLRSPVFQAMFSVQMNEARSNEVRIPDIAPSVMHEFLRFLYTDSLSAETLQACAEPLLAAACKYQVAGLEQLCENHLAASLCVSNAAAILHLADLYEAHALKARALHFIASNAKAAVATEAFFQRVGPALLQEVICALAGLPPAGHPRDPRDRDDTSVASADAPSAAMSPSAERSPSRIFAFGL